MTGRVAGAALRLPSFAAFRTTAWLTKGSVMGANINLPRAVRPETSQWPRQISHVPPSHIEEFADGDDSSIRNHWALLVAGSAG